MAIHNNTCDKCNKNNLVSQSSSNQQAAIDEAARKHTIVRLYINNGNPNMRRDYHTLCLMCWLTVLDWMRFNKASQFPSNTPFDALLQRCGKCNCIKHAYYMHTVADLYNYEKDQYALCSTCMKGFLSLFGDSETDVYAYPAYAELDYVKRQFMTQYPEQAKVLYGGG